MSINFSFSDDYPLPSTMQMLKANSRDVELDVSIIDRIGDHYVKAINLAVTSNSRNMLLDPYIQDSIRIYMSAIKTAIGLLTTDEVREYVKNKIRVQNYKLLDFGVQFVDC
jgi:hypothetical protein